MTIFIVGLGLMGSSYAERLSQKGHTVYGFDSDLKVLEKAINDKLINNDSRIEKLKLSDLIILALYPSKIVDFIINYQKLFKKGSLITDISGTKENMLNKVEDILREDVSYLSHHPMAGRAKRGYESKDSSMFKGNNFLIIKNKNTLRYNVEILKRIADDLGFKKTHILTSDEHDKNIAYTSQLTHIIATALMCGNEKILNETTGDSFRDLTRIANINEDLWTELFLSNKKNLIESIEQFEKKIKLYKDLLITKDSNQLKKELIKARKLRVKFENNKWVKLSDSYWRF